MSFGVSLPSNAQPVTVDWTSSTSGNVCSSAISVTALSGGSTGFSNNDDTFDNGDDVDGLVYTPEGIYDSVNISGRANGSVTFSSAIRNPVLHFYQLDGNSLTFPLGAGQSVSLLSSNVGQASSEAPGGTCGVSLVGNTLTGCQMSTADQNTGPSSPKNPDATAIGELEGAGTLQFTGDFTQISYTSNTAVTGDNTTRWAVSVSCMLPFDDTGTATSGAATTAAANITTNDVMNGGTVDLTPSTGNAAITELRSWPSGLSLNTTTGAVIYDGTALTPGTYELDYQLCDLNGPANCEAATVSVDILQGPIISITKTAEVIDVLGNGGYAVPGNDIEYTFTLSNTGGAADPGSLTLTDRLPDQVSVFTGDLDGAGQPVIFNDTSSPASGLSCCTSGQIAFADEISGPPVFDYVPVTAYDSAITYIQITPGGTLRDGQSTPVSVEFKFRVRLE